VKTVAGYPLIHMKQWIRNLSDRGEFFLVIAICFAYFVATSAAVLLMRIATFEITTGRALRGIVVELVLLAIAGWILRVREFPMSRLSRRPTFGTVLGGVPLFAGYLALYWGASIALTLLVPSITRVTAVKMVPAASLAVMIALIIVNSLFEEIAVTGYVVAKLAPQGAGLAITASTLLRFLYHLYQGPVASLSILPLGLLFAFVYWKTRSLWPLFVGHTIANFAALLLSHQS
jgi:uncharacterized protein